MKIKAGTLSFMIDGVRRAIAGDFTIMVLDEKREPLEGMDGSVGMKVTRVAPMIEGQLYDTTDLDVRELTKLQDVTVTAEQENGKAWVLRNAFYSGDGNVNPSDAIIDLRFHGESIEEVS